MSMESHMALTEARMIAEAKADRLTKCICDVHEYLKHDDIGAAKIRLRASGVIP